MASPHNIAINVPATRKGPKGTCDFMVFFPHNISATPIIAPIENAEKRANTIFGKPNKSPIKKANFTSPNPIHSPRDKRKSAKKNPIARNPERIGYNRGCKLEIKN